MSFESSDLDKHQYYSSYSVDYSQDENIKYRHSAASTSLEETEGDSHSENDEIGNVSTDYQDESTDDDESHNDSSSSELEGEAQDKVTFTSFSKSVEAIEDARSMASEVTEGVRHTSPHLKRQLMLSQKESNSSYPDEIFSAESGVPSTISDQSKTNHVSNTSRTHVPRILVNHQRVPGGAAAKLIGRKRDDDYHFVNDGDDALEVLAPVEELIKSRDMAKAEFARGSTENKRYHAPVREEKENDVSSPTSEGSVPRILDRDEVFHENAAAAIVSILTPSNKSSNAPEIVNILTARSSDIHLSPSSNNNNVQAKKSFSSPFLRPNITTIKSVGSDANYAVEDAIETMTSTGKNPLVQHLLTKKTERHLAAIKNRMKDPTKNLTELMEAIASPQNGLFDRHYMVRRKNACGALKVMIANASHRVNICWTVGVLPALASVLEDSGPDTLEDKFPNASIRREFFETRKRALDSLVYLAQPKNNKLPIFHCPRLVASLVRVIEQDDGEARRSCCTVLAHLSKSKENRLIMAQVPGLLDAITTVIEPKDNYSGSDEDFMSSHSVDSGEASEVDIFDQPSNDEEIEMSISEKSPEQTMSEERMMSEDVADLSARYDEDPDPFLHGARLNVFALLSHLVKEKDNAYILARHAYLVSTLVAITKLQESSSQDFGLKLLANLSRHRANSKILVFKMKDVVPAIVFATNSNNDTSRKYACYALQNLSQDKPCRQQLASIENLLPAVCRSIRSATDPDEKLAALHTIKNLTDEPANLIPMSNTPECFATLIQVAHASDDSITEMMQYVGCDALATLSHWFRSIATSGQRIGTVQSVAKDELFVPSQRVLTWEPWQ